MRLKLADDKSGYVLETMSGQTIKLSLLEMDQLTLLLDRLQHQLKQSSSRAAGAMATTWISNVAVNIDRHHTEVILVLQDRGLEHAYTLSPDIARVIRDGISYQLEAIEAAARKGRRTQ